MSVWMITGAGRGLGLEVARTALAEGEQVALAARRPENVPEDVLHHPNAFTVRLDVTDQAQIDSAVAEVADRFGTIDVLVNNAGVLHFSAVDETELADYERLVRINQVGAFLGMRTVTPVMSEAGSGSIINVSSIEGLAAMPHVVAYTATKFAVRGMTKAAALELGERGIRVNSVHPGMIDTDMLREFTGHDADLSPVGRKLALRRLGEPEEIADLMVFLGSGDSSYCTGAEFVADGGATAAHSLQT